MQQHRGYDMNGNPEHSMDGATIAAEESDGNARGLQMNNLPSELEKQPAAVPPPGPPAPPDGGTEAWLQVAGGFFVYFNTWGLINTFGLFQAYYQSSYLATYSPSQISWIGTIQGWLLIVVGVLGGPLYDLGYLKHQLAVGTLLTVLGLMMTSIADQYYSIFLSLGVCQGIGMGCIFFPGVSAITMWFGKRRATATSIAAMGSAIGTIIYPIVLRELISRVGFGWAVRVIGFICLATQILPLVVMRAAALPPVKRQLIDMTALQDRPFAIMTYTNFFGWLGVLVPNFYIPLFAEQVLGIDQNSAFYLLAIYGAGSVPGRFLPGLLADRFGAIRIYAAAMGISGIMALAWMGVHSWAGIIAFSICYGITSGGIFVLPTPVIAALSPDPRKMGTHIGLCFFIASFGVLAGNPIAGAIVRSSGGFKGLQGFAGAFMIFGSALMFGVDFLFRKKLRAREKR